jgi:probable F420-dependent oxidoreductase
MGNRCFASRKRSRLVTELRPFRFGVVGINARSRVEWAEKARKAEALGFATLLVWDHFADQLAPLPALLAAADATTSLRVAPCVLANDYRHPVVLAKEAATIDLLTDGRFELGIGAGWNRDEYQRAGLPFDPPLVRVRRLAESVQLIKALFGDAPVNYQGQYYTVTDLQGFPRPTQRPHPPIMIGGARRHMLALAAREANIVAFATKVDADGTQHFGDSTGPAIARKLAWVREVAGPRFTNLELHIHVGGVIVTPQRRETAEQMAPTVGLTGPQLLDCLQALIGTVDEIEADLVRRREQYGISYIGIDERFMDALAPIVARLAGR